jgi:hypothetical protein
MGKRYRFLWIIGLVAIMFIAPNAALAGGFQTNANIKNEDGAKVIQFDGSVDTNESYQSNEFFLTNCDNENWYTYPLTFGAKLSGTSSSTRKITLYVQGSNFKDGDFNNIDTLLASDSVNTEIYKTFDLNGKKYWRYKIKVVGTTGNANTSFEFAIYAYRRE